MRKVVRLPFVVHLRGSLLIVLLLTCTANIQAAVTGVEIAGSRPTLFPGQGNREASETGSPNSTPTFTSALLLPLIKQTDLIAASDNEKLRNDAKAPATTRNRKSTLPPLPNPALQWGENAGFQWGSALRQAALFMGIQHAFRMATEAGSRADLKGPFFRDYFTTVTKLRGWDDGDPFIVNYIGHPMMGSVTGYIQIQNDPRGIGQELGLTKSYWKSRLKAFGWSFVYSTQFELGPISEASLGNVGIRPYDGRKHPMAYVDIAVTPVVGTAWLVGEDALDKYLIRQLDRKVDNRVLRALLRSFLNPTRSMANVLRGKYPWDRDDRRF